MDTKSVNNVSDIAFCVAEESSSLFPENVTAMLKGVEQSVLVWTWAALVCGQATDHPGRSFSFSFCSHLINGLKYSISGLASIFLWPVIISITSCHGLEAPRLSTFLKYELTIWAAAWDFQQFDILTGIDSDEPLQPPFKLRNSKWCSVSSLIIIEYSSD